MFTYTWYQLCANEFNADVDGADAGATDDEEAKLRRAIRFALDRAIEATLKIMVEKNVIHKERVCNELSLVSSYR